MSIIDQLVAKVKATPVTEGVFTASQRVLEFRTIGYRAPRQTGKTTNVIAYANQHSDKCAVVVANKALLNDMQPKLTPGIPVSTGREFGQVVNVVSDTTPMPGIKYLLIDDAEHTLRISAIELPNLGYWAAEALDDDAIIILIG